MTYLFGFDGARWFLVEIRGRRFGPDIILGMMAVATVLSRQSRDWSAEVATVGMLQAMHEDGEKRQLVYIDRELPAD